MLAWIDYSTPQLFDAKSVFLILVLGFLAYLISPRSPMENREKDRLALVYPMLIFVYFVLFQIFGLSLYPGIYYYHSLTHQFSWEMNSGICCAFGIAFSFRILRTREIGWRFYGMLSMLIFLLLMLVGMSPAVTAT